MAHADEHGQDRQDHARGGRDRVRASVHRLRGWWPSRKVQTATSGSRSDSRRRSAGSQSAALSRSSPWRRAGPGDLVAGPDGKLWLAEFKASKIGRITLSGSITEYPVPTPDSSPLKMVVAPTGDCGSRRPPRGGSAVSRHEGRTTAGALLTESRAPARPGRSFQPLPDGLVGFLLVTVGGPVQQIEPPSAAFDGQPHENSLPLMPLRQQAYLPGAPALQRQAHVP